MLIKGTTYSLDKKSIIPDDLEKMSKIQKVDITFNLVETIKQAKQGAVKSFLVMGRCLDLIKEKRLWGYYGEHIETFEDLLRELRIGTSTAYNCMSIWERFGEMILSKNLEIDYFRLVRLLPVAKEEEEVEEWLEKAQDLDIKGFDNEIREAQGKVPTDKCSCNGDRIYLVKCLICGKTRKVGKEQLLKELKKNDLEQQD